MQRIFALLFLGYLFGRWDSRCSRQDNERKLAKSIAQPQDVTTWEGEGGLVPDSVDPSGARVA